VEPVEIACTLEAEDVPTRVAEWRALVEEHVTGVERGERTVRLWLRGEESLPVAADLARREEACCAFLAFSFVTGPEGVRLDVEAPPGAGAVLQDLLPP
jgi:hypothetical protein